MKQCNLLPIPVLLAVLLLGCRSNTGGSKNPTAVPNRCYEERTYRVFIPTGEEICPEPQKVFDDFRRRQAEFNKKHYDATPVAMERAFVEEFVGAAECREIWFEKWVTVTANNRRCRCQIEGCLDLWDSDHPAIPPGKLPEDSGFPYYEQDRKLIPCGTGNCDDKGPSNPAVTGIHIK